MSSLQSSPEVSTTNIDEISLDESHGSQVARTSLREHLYKTDEHFVHDNSEILAELEAAAPEGAYGIHLSVNDAAQEAGNRAYYKVLDRAGSTGAGAMETAMRQQEIAKYHAVGAADALEQEHQMTLDDADTPDLDGAQRDAQEVPGIDQEEREAIAIENPREQEEREAIAVEERQAQEIQERQEQEEEQRRQEEIRRRQAQDEEQELQESLSEELTEREEQEEWLYHQIISSRMSQNRGGPQRSANADQVTERDGREIKKSVLAILYEFGEFTEQS